MKERNERRLRAGRLGGLIALNGVLLLLLAAVTFSPAADAQQVRARGSYSMVGGRVNGSAAGAVWIVDTTNQEMIVITTEPNSKELVGVGYRDLAADAGSLGRGGLSR